MNLVFYLTQLLQMIASSGLNSLDTWREEIKFLVLGLNRLCTVGPNDVHTRKPEKAYIAPAET